MHYITRAAIIAVAPLVILSSAYAADNKNQGYLTDRYGAIVTVRSGPCMRSRDWTPNRADKNCKAIADNTSGKSGRAH